MRFGTGFDTGFDALFDQPRNGGPVKLLTAQCRARVTPR
jgi:hypothetical protein